MKQVIATGIDDARFRMTVQDVFVVEGRGPVACGKVESGSVTVRDKVCIERVGRSRVITVHEVEALGKSLSTARVGDYVGLVLGGVRRDEIQSGDVVTHHG